MNLIVAVERVVGPGSLEPLVLLSGLLGGLALFLFGIDQMSGALKAVAGDRMKVILARLTTNRVTGALTGALVTAVIQSSSVTTVLVVGFISAGLMTVSQSIGVIFGANIGTTITAQIIAFRVTRYALPMVALGFALLFAGRRERLRHYGKLIMGLGLLFYGMTLMGDSMQPLRGFPEAVGWMARLDAPWLGILAGAAFTALVQSSSATTGIVIVMAAEGLIGLPAGIALILGANIGTCVTTLLAALGRSAEARRAAVVHVGFNLLGVLVWLPFIDLLAEWVLRLSPAGAARQIANAHTIFNVANAVVLLPFASWFGRAAAWIAPDRASPERARRQARYLDPELLATPSLALDRTRLELLRMGQRAREMLRAICPAVLSGTRDELRQIASMDDDVDALHGQIVTFLGRISQTELTERQTEELLELFQVSNDLENIGDIIETNLVTLGRQRADQAVRVSEQTRRLIEDFHAKVVEAIDSALRAVSQKDSDAARAVTAMKLEINRLAETAVRHQAERLVALEPNRLSAYAVESDILSNLKRVYYFCKRMARATIRST
jgi:phosphate:Na+ symporter